MRRAGAALALLSVALVPLARVSGRDRVFLEHGGAAVVLLAGIVLFTIGAIVAWRRGD